MENHTVRRRLQFLPENRCILQKSENAAFNIQENYVKQENELTNLLSFANMKQYICRKSGKNKEEKE